MDGKYGEKKTSTFTTGMFGTFESFGDANLNEGTSKNPTEHPFSDPEISSDSASDADEGEDKLASGKDTAEANAREQRASKAYRFKKQFSTRYQSRKAATRKAGYVMKFTNRVKGWKRRWFALVGSRLYYAKVENADTHVEVSIKNASIAEESKKNADNGFFVLPREGGLRLHVRCTGRLEMEEWITAFREAASSRTDDDLLLNDHVWHLDHTNHTKHCSVCLETCSVGGKALACAVCSLRIHSKCSPKAPLACKWATLEHLPQKSQIPKIDIPHQWVKSDMSIGSKCQVCSKSCSSKRIEDYRCLWCRRTVHGVCRLMLSPICSLGRLREIILPPSYVQASTQDGASAASAQPRQGRRRSSVPMEEPVVTKREMRRSSVDVAHDASILADELTAALKATSYESHAISMPKNASPLVIFINPKSGSNEGVTLMGKLKSLLNPIQVCDISRGGPAPGLIPFSRCPSFRGLACGGDGTVGWVLQEADRLNINQMQLAVLPMGTGNDLARVLGWGASFEGASTTDHIIKYLDKVRTASPQMFDRWQIFKKKEPADGTGACDSVSAMPSRHSTFGTQPRSRVNSDVESHSRKDEDWKTDLASRLGVNKAETEQNAAGTSNGASDSEDVCGFGQDIDDVYKVSQAVRDAADTVRKLGRLLETFFDRLADLFSQASVKPDDSVLSCDDLSQIVQEYVASITKLRALEELEDIQDDTLKELCDEIEIKTNSFLAIVFDKTSPDSEAATAMVPLVDSVHRIGSVVDSLSGDGDVTLKRRTKATPVRGASTQERPISAMLLGAGIDGGSKAEEIVDSDGDGEGELVSVMNNYFGIGLDAKIALDFDRLRKENPARCRNRLKNIMWYGILATKEMTQQTCKNFQERLTLECDGKVIKLPKLQGIVILNISSYMGGTNFWGTKVEKRFRPPAYDDGMLEVVAVSGTSQMAAIKALPGVNPTRLAQARVIKITISGRESVPMQIDGEPQMIEPCTLTLTLQGRMKLLCRDKALSRMLAGWSGDVKATVAPSGQLSSLLVMVEELITSINAVVAPGSPGAAASANLCVFIKNMERAMGPLLKTKVKVSRSDVINFLSSVGTTIEEVFAAIDMPREVAASRIASLPQKENEGGSKGVAFSSIDPKIGARLLTAVSSCSAGLSDALEAAEEQTLVQRFDATLSRRVSIDMALTSDFATNNDSSHPNSPHVVPRTMRSPPGEETSVKSAARSAVGYELARDSSLEYISFREENDNANSAAEDEESIDGFDTEMIHHHGAKPPSGATKRPSFSVGGGSAMVEDSELC